MENQDGKRVARGPGMPRGGKIALAVVLVLVLALAGGYVGLCAYAGSSAFLPNTSIAGVDVSGQSREGAAAALEGALPGLLALLSIGGFVLSYCIAQAIYARKEF